jgi:hypothetical protein
MSQAENSYEKRCVYEMKNDKKLYQPAAAGKEHFSYGSKFCPARTDEREKGGTDD